jgi:hypothetical protein
MVDNKDQQLPQSYIQIIFKEPGSTLFSADAHGVTPMQFLALGEYFRLLGEAGWLREQTQREVEAERGKIVVPDGILR